MLLCGHHEACMYRYLHKGIRKKYCLPCVIERFPDAEINSEPYKKKFAEQEEKLPPEKIVTKEPIEESW